MMAFVASYAAATSASTGGALGQRAQCMPLPNLAAPIEAPAEIAPEVMRRDKGSKVESRWCRRRRRGRIVGGIPGESFRHRHRRLRRRAAVRVGVTPALVKRVEPTYPEIAASAQLTGIVILEAIVGTDGCMDSVKVLRSRHPFLDRASVDALRQWQYSPLMLNGIKTPFIVTVTFNFSVTHS